MSCISSNFSSFFLNSLNDPSEFSKYLSNGELRFSSTFEDFQVYGQNNVQQQHHINGGVGVLVNANGELISSNGEEGNSNIENTQPVVTPVQHYGSYQAQHQQQAQQNHHGQHQQQQTRWTLPHNQASHQQNLPQNSGASPSSASASGVLTSGGQHFDGSFEFMKYLRHSNDYTDNSHDVPGQQNPTQSSHATAVGTKPEASLNNGLMDLDSAHKRATARKTPVLSSANSNHHNSAASNSSHPTPMDIYDHDSKHNIYDLHHMNSVHSSNSNESSMELSSITYPNSHLNASNSNTSSEGGTTQNHSDFSMLSGVANSQTSSTANAASATAGVAAASTSPAAPKPLASFTINDNFDAHPSHKVEEGIFQHMNKLPPKKKDNLKQLGVRFTGQMTLNDKSIIVENFIKFCQEYDIKDHRPFLSLNQSGLNKPDQIKFARYLGQGLPTFTLFCIYSNFKNLFCTKRTEIYTKDGYNLPYILDKIKCFLANTTAGNNNNNASNSSSTSTTTKDSSSNRNSSTNSNTTPNTTAVNANNSNNNAANAVPMPIQNGNSNSNSSSGNSNNSTGNDNGKISNSSCNSIFSNDIINTPTKQIHNVPSPTTPRTPQIQHHQTPQIPIQTQNTPLPAHPPPPTHANTHIMATHAATPQTHLHTHHHQQLQQQQQLQIHQQQPQHQHQHVQMPMSPMVVVTSAASVAAPSTIIASTLPPTVPVPVPAPATVTVTQTTTNHNQHPHHLQPNINLPLHHHPHHHVNPVAQPSIQHHTTAVVYQQQQQQHQHHQQHQQQHHHPQQQQLQNHHPLHNLASQNPPL